MSILQNDHIVAGNERPIGLEAEQLLGGDFRIAGENKRFFGREISEATSIFLTVLRVDVNNVASDKRALNIFDLVTADPAFAFAE